MTVQEVVNCAPFRLDAPRPLTPFEWTVVRTALRSGYQTAGVFAMSHQARAQIEGLVGAIANQTRCPRWRTSMFGPAPAVSPYAYECIGYWYATLDPASQARALYDIMHGGLLCGAGLPAGYAAYRCAPVSDQMRRGQVDGWEGAPQQGEIQPGYAIESCAYVRDRIAYTPMTGTEMLELLRSTGGTVPPELEQAAQFATFLKRSFLLGIQVRKASAGVLASGDMMAMAKAAIEEAVLIWAPGKGASVRFLLDGSDPAKLMALIAAMAPDLLPEILPNLPNLLPGLLPWVFGSGSQIAPKQLAGFGQAPSTAMPQPGTDPNTGLPVVDNKGKDLPKDKPPIGGLKLPSFTPTTIFIGAVAAALLAAFAYAVASPRRR